MFRKRKNKISRILLNKIVLSVIGFLVIIAISVPLARNVSKQHRINSEIKELQAEIAGLNDKKSNLNSLMDYLRSDQFNEEQARLKLNYKKEGEEVAVIKNDEISQSLKDKEIGDNFRPQTASEKPINKEVNNPLRWLEYFFKI